MSLSGTGNTLDYQYGHPLVCGLNDGLFSLQIRKFYFRADELILSIWQKKYLGSGEEGHLERCFNTVSWYEVTCVWKWLFQCCTAALEKVLCTNRKAKAIWVLASSVENVGINPASALTFEPIPLLNVTKRKYRSREKTDLTHKDCLKRIKGTLAMEVKHH